jgi:hypothetical protein
MQQKRKRVVHSWATRFTLRLSRSRSLTAYLNADPWYAELNARPAMVVVIVPVAVVQIEAVATIEAAASAKAVVITDLATNAVRVSGSCEYHRGGQRRGGSSHERDNPHGFLLLLTR